MLLRYSGLFFGQIIKALTEMSPYLIAEVRELLRCLTFAKAEWT